MIEERVNRRNDYIERHKRYINSSFPDAKENTTRTLAEDLELAEKLRNDFQFFCEWYAIEGYAYAKKAHNIIRKQYDDRDNEIADLFFDVKNAVKNYGFKYKSTEPADNILPLGRFIVHCCCRHLYNLADKWNRHGKKFVSLQTDDLAFERGIPDGNSDIPELMIMLRDFIEVCKDHLSDYERQLFIELLKGFKLEEICLRWSKTGVGSDTYKSLDNAYQRIVIKLRKHTNLAETYRYIADRLEHLRRMNSIGSDEVWQWVDWQFRVRNKVKNETDT